MTVICTDSLIGNLRLWSVISNWIRLVETGHVEAIINFYILFIKFYKFYVTDILWIELIMQIKLVNY